MPPVQLPRAAAYDLAGVDFWRIRAWPGAVTRGAAETNIPVGRAWIFFSGVQCARVTAGTGAEVEAAVRFAQTRICPGSSWVLVSTEARSMYRFDRGFDFARMRDESKKSQLRFAQETREQATLGGLVVYLRGEVHGDSETFDADLALAMPVLAKSVRWKA